MARTKGDNMNDTTNTDAVAVHTLNLAVDFSGEDIGPQDAELLVSVLNDLLAGIGGVVRVTPGTYVAGKTTTVSNVRVA
jgi:hypothetical protein